ncbi:MAG: hypothetical protein R3Y54_13755, partial [Eubacteriales bacterium]
KTGKAVLGNAVGAVSSVVGFAVEVAIEIQELREVELLIDEIQNLGNYVDFVEDFDIKMNIVTYSSGNQALTGEFYLYEDVFTNERIQLFNETFIEVDIEEFIASHVKEPLTEPLEKSCPFIGSAADTITLEKLFSDVEGCVKLKGEIEKVQEVRNMYNEITQ